MAVVRMHIGDKCEFTFQVTFSKAFSSVEIFLFLVSLKKCRFTCSSSHIYGFFFSVCCCRGRHLQPDLCVVRVVVAAHVLAQAELVAAHAADIQVGVHMAPKLLAAGENLEAHLANGLAGRQV